MQQQYAPQERRIAGCRDLAMRRFELVRPVNQRPVVQHALSLVLGCALFGTTLVVPAGVRGEIVDVSCMLGPGAVEQTLQAEAAVRGGGVRVVTKHSGFNGSGYVDFPVPPDTQAFIEWSHVDGGPGGEAILEIRNALGASTNRTVRLSVNGVEQLLTFATTGNWSTWQLTPVHVTLQAGADNVVRLQANGQDSANIDELRVPTSCRFLDVNGTIVMEGEHFTGADASRDPGNDPEKDWPWVVGSGQGGAVRQAYAFTHDNAPEVPDADWVNGAELSYAIAFKTPGRYDVWLRRRVGEGGAKAVLVGLDGTYVATSATEATDNTWKWRKLGKPIIVPTAGVHTLQLRRKQSGYRIDRILLTSTSSFTLEETANGPPESSRICPLRGVLEAEHAAFSPGSRVEAKPPDFSGTGYINYADKKDSYVRWTVPELPKQTYTIAFRYATGKSPDRSMDIKVNNVVVQKSLSFPGTIASTTGGRFWGLQTTSAALQSDYPLEATAVTLAGGPHVDYVDITPVTEAEDYCQISAGGSVENQYVGFSGSGYVNVASSLGFQTEWTLTVPTTGSYVLTFRYANGSSTAQPMHIKVNGLGMAYKEPFPPTGAWDTWARKSIIVGFNAGQNTVRISPTPKEPLVGLHIDHIGWSFDL